MKKMQLLMLSLILPVFMGHAKDKRHGWHNAQGWAQQGMQTGTNAQGMQTWNNGQGWHHNSAHDGASKPHHKPEHKPEHHNTLHNVHPAVVHVAKESGKGVKKEGDLVGFSTSVGLAGNNNKAVAVQKNGKLVVVAQNSGLSFFAGSVIRYNVDGKPEVIFENPTFLTTTLPGYYAQGVAIEHDQKVIVGYTNSSSFALVRYHQDGTIDHTFHFTLPSQVAAGKLNAMALQHDGKILVGLTSSTAPLMRFLPNGMVDMSFAPDANLSSVTAINVTPWKIAAKGHKDKGDKHRGGKHHDDKHHDGKHHDKHHHGNVQKIVVAGITKMVSGSVPANSATLVKYNLDGTVDQGFHFSGVPAGLTNVQFASVAVQANHDIVVAGSSSNRGALLFRVKPTGMVDVLFSGAVESSSLEVNSTYNAVVIDTKHQGDIVVVGQKNGNNFIVRRFSASGVLKMRTFGDKGTVTLFNGVAVGVALTPASDNIIAVGKIQDGSVTAPIMYKI